MTATLTEQRVREVVREETADMREELYRQGILLEDVQSNIHLVLEVLSDTMTVKFAVANHEERLITLEKWQTLLLAATKSDRPKMA